MTKSHPTDPYRTLIRAHMSREAAAAEAVRRLYGPAVAWRRSVALYNRLDRELVKAREACR